MDRVVHNERVITVRQLANDTVEVETDTTVYQCEYAVVTVSLGVLKNQLIQFIPDLPTAKTRAIESIGFGVVTKVFLEYEVDLWTLDTELPDGGFYFQTFHHPLGKRESSLCGQISIVSTQGCCLFG